jgi:glycosyltransferase involved in cell wall biosynthesis
VSNEAAPDAARPQISVIMPMLDARPFLKYSIGSILSQSWRDFELLVVDNGSTDGSRKYAESFKDSRIKVLAESRRGAAHAINAGIAASRGDLLAMMDADDVSLENRLLLQAEYLQRHSDVVLVGTRFSFLIGDTVVPTAPPLMQHRDIRLALLAGAPAISQGSTMFRAWAARKVRGHNLNGPAHDFDFFLRMSEVGLIHNLPSMLYLYRVHPDSSTTKTTTIIREHQKFAIVCAMAREAGAPEPSFEEFHHAKLLEWRISGLTDRCRGVSAYLYRNAMIQRATGKRVSPALNIICAALLNPRMATLHLKRHLIGLRFDGVDLANQ